MANIIKSMSTPNLKNFIDYTDDMDLYAIAVEELRSRNY